MRAKDIGVVVAAGIVVLLLSLPLACFCSMQESIDDINANARERANWPAVSDHAVAAVPLGATRRQVIDRLGEPYPMRRLDGPTAGLRGCIYYRADRPGDWRLWRFCFEGGVLKSKTL